MVNNNIKSILITDDVDEKCVKILENNGFQVTKNIKLSKPELLEEIKKYDALIVRSATKVTEEVLNSASENLKLVARAGTGVDNIDVKFASEKNILVMNALGSNTISAAELTCSMISALARHLPQANMSMKQGKWERSKFMGTELFGKTLAVIGLGRIGREVASRMKSFGMELIGYDPMVSKADAEKFGIKGMDLEQIWPVADYITIHVPLMESTMNLMCCEVFGQCKKGFRLVNCARGGIVNESDLLKALNEGVCGGAALDVFCEEPPKCVELIQHPKFICTPHLG
jgi:D-3-phosphoglycerate dehydrogenase